MPKWKAGWKKLVTKAEKLLGHSHHSEADVQQNNKPHQPEVPAQTAAPQPLKQPVLNQSTEWQVPVAPQLVVRQFEQHNNTGPYSEHSLAEAGSCGSVAFAVKSVVGMRMGQEDAYTSCLQWLSASSQIAQGFFTAEALPPPTPALGPKVLEEPGEAVADGSEQVQSFAPSPPSNGRSPHEFLHFFAVYDGHGGASVSKHCSQQLHIHLKRLVEGGPELVQKCAAEVAATAAAAAAATAFNQGMPLYPHQQQPAPVQSVASSSPDPGGSVLQGRNEGAAPAASQTGAASTAVTSTEPSTADVTDHTGSESLSTLSSQSTSTHSPATNAVTAVDAASSSCSSGVEGGQPAEAGNMGQGLPRTMADEHHLLDLADHSPDQGPVCNTPANSRILYQVPKPPQEQQQQQEQQQRVQPHELQHGGDMSAYTCDSRLAPRPPSALLPGDQQGDSAAPSNSGTTTTLFNRTAVGYDGGAARPADDTSIGRVSANSAMWSGHQTPLLLPPGSAQGDGFGGFGGDNDDDGDELNAVEQAFFDSGRRSPEAFTRASQAALAKAAAQPAPPLPDSLLEAALLQAFACVDQELQAEGRANEMGTTAVVALVGERHIWVANCGDSRAVLCREEGTVAMSLDHKATRNDEVARIEQAGGYVWWDRVMGELAVSRAIGDHCLRPFVIAVPEITCVRRRDEDMLLILASDGLWDVFTNQEARDFAVDKWREELGRGVPRTQRARRVAAHLVKCALARGSRDNITVMIVELRHGAALERDIAAEAEGAQAALAAAAAASAAAAAAAKTAAAAVQQPSSPSTTPRPAKATLTSPKAHTSLNLSLDGHIEALSKDPQSLVGMTIKLKPPTHAALAKAAAVLAAEELGGPAVHQGGAQGAQVRSPRSLQTGIVEFLKQQEQVPPPPKRSLMPASEGSLNGLAAAVQAAPVPPAPTPTAAVSQLSQDGHLLSAPTSHLKDGYSGGRHGSAAGTGIVAAAPAAADPEGKDKPARSRSRLFSFLH